MIIPYLIVTGLEKTSLIYVHTKFNYSNCGTHFMTSYSICKTDLQNNIDVVSYILSYKTLHGLTTVHDNKITTCVHTCDLILETRPNCP